jgi:hypothetical protein
VLLAWQPPRDELTPGDADAPFIQFFTSAGEKSPSVFVRPVFARILFLVRTLGLGVESGGGGESKGCRCAPTRLANDCGEPTRGDSRAGSGARAWRQRRSFTSRKSFGERVGRFSFQSQPADDQCIEWRRISLHASGGDAGSCARFQLAGFVVRPASRSACPRRDGQDSATHVRFLVQS